MEQGAGEAGSRGGGEQGAGVQTDKGAMLFAAFRCFLLPFAAFCYLLLLFAAFCCFLVLFAAFLLLFAVFAAFCCCLLLFAAVIDRF